MHPSGDIGSPLSCLCNADINCAGNSDISLVER